MRQDTINFAKYVLVGGFVTLLDWSIYATFSIWLSFNYLLVGGLGFALGILLNYELCVKFIYKSGARFEQKQEMIAVYIVGGIGLILHEVLLLVAHESLLFSLMLSKVFATGIVLFWNFGARNFYVFAEPRK